MCRVLGRVRDCARCICSILAAFETKNWCEWSDTILLFDSCGFLVAFQGCIV